MKKLERYDISDFGYVPCSDGDVCKSEDVANLEAINAQLLEALETIRQDVLGYCICYDEPERERIAWAKADAAIAKAKGEML